MTADDDDLVSVDTVDGLRSASVGIYAIFLSIALWRAYALLRVDRERVSTNYTSFKERQVFHALVALYALLETAAAASEREAHRMYTKAGYGMHLVALCVQVSAVSVVVVHWSTALSKTCLRKRYVTTALVVWNAAVLVFSAISVGYVGSDETLALYSGSLESFWYGIIVAVTLLLYTVVLLTYGVLMQLKLTSRSNARWDRADLEQRIKILCRINTVLVVCVVCFMIRAALVIILLVKPKQLPEAFESSERWEWLLLTEWLPGVCPSGVLLYVMRQPTRRMAHMTPRLIATPSIASNESFNQSFINSPSFSRTLAGGDSDRFAAANERYQSMRNVVASTNLSASYVPPPERQVRRSVSSSSQ